MLPWSNINKRLEHGMLRASANHCSMNADMYKDFMVGCHMWWIDFLCFLASWLRAHKSHMTWQSAWGLSTNWWLSIEWSCLSCITVGLQPPHLIGKSWLTVPLKMKWWPCLMSEELLPVCGKEGICPSKRTLLRLLVIHWVDVL